jgi:hypothetical protein
MPYEMALSWQVFIQLKQSTHLVTSISAFRKSIHEDLQLIAHLPQRVQAASSNRILKRDTFEISPRNVPTGQIIFNRDDPLSGKGLPQEGRKLQGLNKLQEEIL